MCALKALKGERVLVFAQGYKALTENLFSEILKRLDTIIGYNNYTYNKGQVKINIPKTNGTIYGLTYENIDSCRGYTEIHSLILDEGCLAPPDILTVAVPCMRGTGKDTQIYITSTPKAASFLNNLILEKIEKTPNEIELIKAKTIDNSFISSTEYELMLASFSNETIIRQELEGEILNLTAENSIIGGVNVKQGSVPVPQSGNLYIGIDCAGYGKDQTVITYRIGDWFTQECYNHIDGMTAKDRIKSMLRTHPNWHLKNIAIDMAYGDAIYEALSIEYESCDLINFAMKPNDEQYLNMRAEMYFTLVDALRKGFMVTEEIYKELQATLFEWSNNGRLKLVDKDEIKEIIGHSPDKSDSLALTFSSTIYTISDLRDSEENTTIDLGDPGD